MIDCYKGIIVDHLIIPIALQTRLGVGYFDRSVGSETRLFQKVGFLVSYLLGQMAEVDRHFICDLVDSINRII